MSHDTLISANDLRALGSEVLIVDCRFDLADLERGAREFAGAHIPGAVYAHLNRDLSDLTRSGVGRHPLPDAEVFSDVLCAWGWTPHTQLVAYDDSGGALAAARLWWMLRLAGSRSAAVLDGGLKAWREAGFETSAESPPRQKSSVEIEFDAAQIVMTDELQRLRGDGSTLLLDARAAPRYRGEVEPIDRVAGHVPGAINRPFSENLDATGRFKPADQLRREFESIVAPHTPGNVVHMCGSGVTACHNFLSMEHAGLSGSRIYAPSWSGWIADERREVAIGAN